MLHVASDASASWWYYGECMISFTSTVSVALIEKGIITENIARPFRKKNIYIAVFSGGCPDRVVRVYLSIKTISMGTLFLFLSL